MCLVSGTIMGVSAAVINSTLASAAISGITSVATGVSQANATTAQNQRTADMAARARALEQAKVGAGQRQVAEAATRKRQGIERARIAAQGEAMAQAAETGAQGNFLESIKRGVNIQAGDKVSAVQAQQALAQESARYGDAESQQRLSARIGSLDAGPNLGLTIGTGVLAGAAQGFNAAGGWAEMGASSPNGANP